MAINFDALNQVYNHYLTEYAPKSNTPLDTHKKSDLRNIYNSIVKLNKESPLYLPSSDAETKSYAVGLKESVRQFRNSLIATQGNIEDGTLLCQKKAYSSSPDIASAEYIGEDNGDAAPSFRLEVARLASPQVNMGIALPSNDMLNLSPGAYSFDLSVSDINYEFQFQLHSEDTNLSIQERLSRLITNAEIGVKASVLEDGQGSSSLKLESVATGVPAHKNQLFNISDDQTSKSKGIVNLLGLSDMTRSPENALFEINGIERTASSNTFTIEKQYAITLHSPGSSDTPFTEIGLMNDSQSMTENIHALTDSYNSFINSITTTAFPKAKNIQLMSELNYISRHYSPDLNAIGLSFNDSGQISINQNMLSEASSDDDSVQKLSVVRDFADSMLRKSNQISLNPMQYVDKTIVAYKNPGKNFASPYITSSYSGMLFNNYC